uniref:MARVEL domain-containing protein n=1 Tax=Soboliphyme baturini TaxID=241478 RepID=A0A183IVE7_9BILA
LTFVCTVAGPYSGYGGAGWATFVSIVSFICTLTLLIMYFVHLIEMLKPIPWLLLESIYCVIWTVFYFIAAIVLAHAGAAFSVAAAWGAASLLSNYFMLLVFLVCGYVHLWS